MLRRRSRCPLVIGLAALIIVGCGRGPSDTAAKSAAPSDALAAGFAHPPDSARPWVYWLWMDGNLSREGITADLEAMRARRHRRRHHHGGERRHPARAGQVHEPRVARALQARGRGGGAAGPARSRSTPARAGPAAAGRGSSRSSRCSTSSPARSRSPGRRGSTRSLPRPARRPAFFGDGRSAARRSRPRRTTSTGTWPCWPFRRPPPAARSPTSTRRRSIVRAPYSSQPGVKPFLPSPAEYPGLPAGAAIDPATASST